jgi:hypothetical protein
MDIQRFVARLFSGITAFSKRHKTMEHKPEKKDKKRSCNWDNSEVALLRELHFSYT